MKQAGSAPLRFIVRQPTQSQLSRWLACGLLVSSAALSGAVLLLQSRSAQGGETQRGAPSERSSDPASPKSPAGAANPASPTAPAAITPDTRPPPEPRTAAEIESDASIARRVKQALASDALTGSESIDIEVTRGIVNLSGSVSGSEVAHRALSIARSTGGVTAVQDAMKVEGREEVRVLR